MTLLPFAAGGDAPLVEPALSKADAARERRADRALQAHRQFQAGDEVQSLVRFRHGEVGTVVERLDSRWDGLARYGVRIRCDQSPGGSATADFCRVELRLVKRPRARRST